ncbi:hypothetical protein ACS3UN_02205 [Oscillospiraceae bacterium LTW-04]|nr:hypothetical protein RBH76_08255 [Oscillospiraceae bacterium MB24-C1]
MSKRYKIWNKSDIVKTRIGERLTPEEWMLRHPEAESEYPIVCAGSINGDISDCMEDMLLRAEMAGFTTALTLSVDTAQTILDEIEAWEDVRAVQVASAISAEERTAAALEYQNLLTM